MKRKVPLILLCILFLGIAASYGIQFFETRNEYAAGEKAYEELTPYIHVEYPGEASSLDSEVAEEFVSEALTESSDEIQWPVVDFEALQEINPDVVAWIYIEGTNINYPVVQGADNSYYLNRLVDGSYNSAGSIFMDYRNECNLADRNTVLYGHHMKNGSMFRQIAKYKDQTFYDQHPVGLIMTPDGNYLIEFVAGYVTDMNSDAWKMEFGSDEEFAVWLESAISQSRFNSNAETNAHSRVVTFSTCTYEYNDARFVLVGVLRI